MISLLKENTSKHSGQTLLQLRFPLCAEAWTTALTESWAPCAWFEFRLKLGTEQWELTNKPSHLFSCPSSCAAFAISEVYVKFLVVSSAP